MAFLASVAFFLIAAPIPIRHHVVPILGLGAVYLYVVLVAAKRLGPLFAVPLAIAGGLAFDSFFIPPLRPFDADHWQNWLVMAIYISTGVLIGVLASRSQRQAEASEGARGLLAEEQAALRRVATLVARGVPPRDVFASVAQELGLLLRVSSTHIGHYEPDGTVAGIGSWSVDGSSSTVGTRTGFVGGSVTETVFKTGRPARKEDYEDTSSEVAAMAAGMGIRSSVAAPIVVDGELWGVMIAASNDHQPLAPDTEPRIAAFTELVATAISNAEARVEVGRLAEEQAALRRVATLVARQAPPTEVFAQVTEEVGRLLGAESALMYSYEPEGESAVVAVWGKLEAAFPIGTLLNREAGNVAALTAVCGPIVVDGRPWGAMAAVAEPMPADAESRIEEFTRLVATAISNIQARSDLAASRARIVTATDETRRRFERDLHDGVQQRLVSLGLELRGAETMIPPELPELRSRLSRVGDEMTGVLDDLRELSRGIHPAILSEGGLAPALKALARRSTVPIKLEVELRKRLAEPVEVAAYYVVSEALANAAKHAQASFAEIHVAARNGVLDLTVQDDGVGGADPTRGSGLTGLADRVEALGGTIAIDSPGGEGTSLHAELPIARSSR